MRDTNQCKATINLVIVVSKLHVTCTGESSKSNQLFRNGKKKGKSGKVFP